MILIFLEIFLLTTFLPCFMTMRNGEDPNEFMDDPKKRIEIIRRKVYQDELKTLLPRMLHLGFFEEEN